MQFLNWFEKTKHPLMLSEPKTVQDVLVILKQDIIQYEQENQEWGEEISQDIKQLEILHHQIQQNQYDLAFKTLNTLPDMAKHHIQRGVRQWIHKQYVNQIIKKNTGDIQDDYIS